MVILSPYLANWPNVVFSGPMELICFQYNVHVPVTRLLLNSIPLSSSQLNITPPWACLDCVFS